MDKAAVLIDGGYIRALNRSQFGMKNIDYLRFSVSLCGPNCERFRTYFYICPPYQDTPPTEDQKRRKAEMDSFLSSLRRYPRFQIRLGRLRRIPRPPWFEQKGVDVLFACDLVKLSVGKAIQKAIIVSGDSDFVPAVRIAKEEMVITKLWYYPRHCSPHLFDVCDERERLTQTLIDSVSF